MEGSGITGLGQVSKVVVVVVYRQVCAYQLEVQVSVCASRCYSSRLVLSEPWSARRRKREVRGCSHRKRDARGGGGGREEKEEGRTQSRQCTHGDT